MGIKVNYDNIFYQDDPLSGDFASPAPGKPSYQIMKDMDVWSLVLHKAEIFERLGYEGHAHMSGTSVIMKSIRRVPTIQVVLASARASGVTMKWSLMTELYLVMKSNK